MKVGRRTVLNAEPGLEPTAMRTSTLASICPMVKAMLPPERGHEVRLLVTVSWPPQGKVPSLGGC